MSYERQRWLVNYFGNKIYIGSFFMWICVVISKAKINLFKIIEGLSEALIAIGIKIMMKIDPKEGRKMLLETIRECECEYA